MQYSCTVCGRITAKRQCPEHTRDRERGSAAARGYGHRWRQSRGRYLKHHPVCEFDGCSRPATDVHHLDGLGPHGPRGYDWSNLQALCHPHHSETTARNNWAAVRRST